MQRRHKTIPNSFFKLAWYFFKPFKYRFILHSLLTIITTTFWSTYFQLSIRHIFEIIEKSKAMGQNLIKEIMPFFFFVIFITGFFILLEYLQSLNYRKFRPDFNKYTKMTLLQYINNHSYSFFLNNPIGSLAEKIDNLSQNIHNFIKNILCKYLADSISTLFALSIFFYIQPLFGIILIIFALIYITISLTFFSQKRVWEKNKAEKKQKVSEEIYDTFSNFTITKSFTCSKHFLQRIKHRIEDYGICWQQQYEFDVKFTTLMKILQYGIVFIIIFLAIFLYANQKISLADFVYVSSSIFPLVNKIYVSVQNTSNFIQELGISDQSIETLLIPHEITDKHNAIVLKKISGKIDFRNITFSYKNKKILSNFNLSIKPLEKIGIVGISGVGKSTIANLLLRFFETNIGSISIDDINIKDIKQDSLRKNIAYVPQDTTLFNRSIAENLSFVNNRYSKKNIKEVCQLVGLEKIINEQSQKYDTVVGEKGLKLSGGQRQRIAIARAMLANKKILIMDEATSAMDSISEKELQQNINLLMENKTCLIIAHRLSTLKEMDRIIVIDKGKVIEEGNHNDLIKKNGLYAKLYKTQNKK